MKPVAKGVCASGLFFALISTAADEANVDSSTRMEVAFCPEAGAQDLIIKTISAADQSVRLAGFAFSSLLIVQALITAKQRGVDVQVVVNYAHNVADDSKGIGRNALARLVQAKIPVKTNDAYRKLHDKFIVVDGKHVQTGSYNYAASANRNSENVLVAWNAPALAQQYLQHWQSRFDEGSPYSPQ